VPESRTNLAWDTLLELDKHQQGAMHDRVTRALRNAIRSGKVPAQSALPPSRTLAADLGCSRWVVTQAYTQLTAEGYVLGRVGSATRVCWTPEAVTPSPPRAVAATPVPRFDLTPGLPDLRSFPRAKWGDLLRRQLREASLIDLGFPDPGGHPRLRRILTEYLHRVRAVTANTTHITTGVTDGATRICRALRAEGLRHIAVEDPGWTRLRDVAADAGLTVVPIPVDDHGLRVDELERHADLRAVITTPAHQFPTGATLSPARRGALVAWARRTGGVVVEDDYDAEFRYDRRPMGTVQGMCPEHVVLLGSVSKTLSPAVGIGWSVAPTRWGRPQGAPPVLDQLAFAELIESGSYDRHLRSLRQRYRIRREALLDALATRLPECHVSGSAAGLHLLADLGGADVAAVVLTAARNGLRLTDVRNYQVRQGKPGLVLGYGNLADSTVTDAVEVLASAVEARS
jgi:GntR family transcriptional regulator/MocR family aminotransferase